MKKSNVSIFSIALNIAALLFFLATFYLQYEFLFVTRIVAIVFATVYLVIEIKKEYFSEHKMLFIVLGAVSIIALIVSVLIDDASSKHLMNERVFFIPVYVFTLIVIMYKDLYDEKTE